MTRACAIQDASLPGGVYPPADCPFCGGPVDRLWSRLDAPSRTGVDCYGCRACDRERWLWFHPRRDANAPPGEVAQAGRLF